MQPRQERREVGLLVSLSCRDVGAFVEQYATNLSKTGMFVRSRDPLPVGSLVELEVQIAGGVRVIRARAEVRWARRDSDGAAPPGMGLLFVELDPYAEAVIERMLEQPPPPQPQEAPYAERVELPAVDAPSPAAPAPELKVVEISIGQLVASTPAAPPRDEASEPRVMIAEPTIEIDCSDFEEAPAPAAADAPAQPRPAAAVAPAQPAPAAGPAAPPPLPKTVFLPPPGELAAQGPIIGIDLGTTNSCVAVLSHGRPVVLRSKEGHNTIPSVVALAAADKLLVGHRAKGQLLLNPAQTIYGAKRLVGRDFDSATVRQVRDRFHYQIVPGADGRAAVRLGPSAVSLEEVQGIILRECKQMAEQHLKAEVGRAVVTVPAYYSEPQREAVRRAGALAGLRVERILNEPTAAALAYGLNRRVSKRVLVYDLGGGTFDATVFRVDNNAFEVLGTGGDIFLGGLDFDSQLVDLLVSRVEAASDHRAFPADPTSIARLAEAAERAKIELSERKSTEVHVPLLLRDAADRPQDLRCTLTRAEVDEACAPLVDRTFDVLRDVLLDAKLKAAQIDEIILVGGQTRMPLVRERLSALFGKTPHASVNADEAVAIGAALYSGAADKVSNVVLIDVLPMTIGLGMQGGGFKRVLERNTPLPANRSLVVPTSRDGQTSLELFAFQGEDAHVSANEYLGTVRIDGLPPRPAGQVRVLVLVKVDAECVLHVEAYESSSKHRVQAELATRYTPEELQRQLKISRESAQTAEARRGGELDSRGGRFWSLLKKVVGRA